MSLDLSVVIPTYGRSAKLRSLLQSIAGTTDEHDAFEVIVSVDDDDDAPLAAADCLPDSIRFVGITGAHAGPATARNRAIERASGSHVLFLDDDVIVEPHTIPGHVRRAREEAAPRAIAGPFDPTPNAALTPWHHLLESSSMRFFWDRMEDGGHYGFRHFWTLNLSVPRDLVVAVGGFQARFPHAMHEDIELGWRLADRFGLDVVVDQGITCRHDHPLTVREYMHREHCSGVSARVAADVNPAFHDATWSWAPAAAAALDALEPVILPAAQRARQLLARLEHGRRDRPRPEELEAAYVAHLPLKRLAFLRGYVGRALDDLAGPGA